jgi:hypothetical protein
MPGSEELALVILRPVCVELVAFQLAGAEPGVSALAYVELAASQKAESGPDVCPQAGVELVVS